MSRLIDADEYEKRIKPYDTEDDMDKALYNFAHYHLVTTSSAQPRKGKWIKISPANIYECSVCGQNVMTNDIEAYRFCHGCGAEMERC